jgi:hypothetical protein
VKAATITRTDSDLEVRFEYSPTTVDALKRRIPRFARQWDSELRMWTIDDLYFDEVLETLNAEHDTRIADRRHPRSVRPLGPPTRLDAFATAISTLLAELPSDHRRRVARTIAAAAHPDAGGNTEVSKIANRLLEEFDR